MQGQIRSPTEADPGNCSAHQSTVVGGEYAARVGNALGFRVESSGFSMMRTACGAWEKQLGLARKRRKKFELASPSGVQENRTFERSALTAISCCKRSVGGTQIYRNMMQIADVLFASIATHRSISDRSFGLF